MFLNCHTWYSFKYGTLSPEKLFQEAKKNNVKKLILTELNNTSSYIEMLRICQENRAEHELEIAVGVEFRKENRFQYLLIAKNNKGFEEINRFLSYCNNQQKSFPDRAPEFEQVVCIYAWKQFHPENLRSYEYIGVRENQLTKFMLDKEHKGFQNKYVAFHPVTFSGELGFSIHRVLRAIDTNVVITKLSPLDQADKGEFMVPPAELEKKFQNFPFLVRNTQTILEQCGIEVTLGTDKNKKKLGESEEADWELLVTLAWEGFQSRYDVSNPELRERFERELNVIKKKEFCPYYMITYDMIRFAKEKGYDFVGRGSGANSIIAYCLGITNVDPIELDLYFERFLNEERTSPPDFDIDFSWKERDFIYDYLFEKHGKNHTCLLGSYSTFQRNAIIREVGKVFGLPKHEIDEIAENPAENFKRDHIKQQIFKYAEHLHDMPSHLSIHAAGVLFSEEPIYLYGATDLPPKNYPVIHMDMYSAEDLGLYKLDVLSQRGLGHIKDTVALVKKTRGISIDITRFKDFKEDEKVKDLLRNSKAMGCFYIESPATRNVLAKLRCEDYLTLVAASSIIRPGVSSSGMMKAYIERYHAVRNGKDYEVIHPKMRELMAETYGVMVYQEDVIRVAHYFAGLTLTQADVLRRGMSGKYRSRKAFQEVQDQFFSNCAERGYDPKVTERVWQEIASFAGYSFAKGHSASFAVESYQSLYLKAYYPLEFMVSVINNFGGFYQSEFYFHEARMLGGRVEAPCVNTSTYLTTLKGEKDIYIGFVHIKSLEQKLAESVIEERERHGPYSGIQDFLHRVNFKAEQAAILIRIGAFRFTGKTKQVLEWEMRLFFSNAHRYTATGELFALEEDNFDLPVLKVREHANAFDEIELLQFPLCDPFLLLKTKERGDTTAATLKEKIGRQVSIVAYLVTIKYTSTKKGETMHFGTFIDQHGVFLDTVHFPDSSRQYPFRGKGFYLIKGKVADDFGVQSIEVAYMEKLPMVSPRE